MECLLIFCNWYKLGNTQSIRDHAAQIAEREESYGSVRLFTLLEMIIVILLFGVISSVVALNAVRLIQFHRFEQEAAELFSALQEAQILAITHETMITLDLFFEQGLWYYRFHTHEPLSYAVLNQRKVPLPRIAKVFLNGKMKKTIQVNIFSDGAVDPNGCITLQSPHEEKRFIDMRFGPLLNYARTSPPTVGPPLLSHP